MQEPLFILIGIVLAALTLGLLYFRKPEAPDIQKSELRLQGEFIPARLEVQGGIPLQLHIHRLESEPEEEWFLIPELNVREPLPPLLTTIVHIDLSRAGEFKVTCRQGKVQGLLIVKEPE